MRIEFTRAVIVAPPGDFGSGDTGSALEFSGRVRRRENGAEIPGLFYEAYEPMARTRLEKILAELGAKHACEEVVFIHRLGFVPVGEASLFIRIGTPHRQEGLAMMGEVIERLKAEVPIWKKAGEAGLVQG